MSPAADRRFPLIPEEKLTPEQRAVADDIRAGPRSKLTTSSASRPGVAGNAAERQYFPDSAQLPADQR